MAVGRPIKLTPNVARKTVSITATAGQTTFTPTGGYRINDLAVYRNGVRLVNGKDFTAVDGANVILQSAATVDDVLEFGIFDSFNIADAISANGNQSMGGDLTVGVSTLYSGTTGILSTNTLYAETIGDTRSTVYGDGSNLTGVANTDYIDAASITSAGIVSVTNTTDSTSSTTGALIVSGGVGIAKSLFVGNNVTIGGTVTYEDVTNVDSVGLITAQTGVRVTAGGLVVTAGVSTLGADLSIADKIVHTGDTNTAIRFPAADTITAETSGTERLRIDSSGNSNFGAEKAVAFPSGTGIQVYHSANPRIKLTNDNTGNSGTDGTQLYLSSDGDTILDNKDSEDVIIHTNASEKLRITSAGNVGINSTAPRALLDVRGSSTFGGGQISEKIAISASALNSSTDINLDEGMVHYRSANLGAASVKPNITSSVGINTALKIGESIAVTIITAVNSTSNYVNALTIDHADVTESWIGGSAPSAGGGSGYDIYAFNILKTANATYIVIGNHTMTSA